MLALHVQTLALMFGAYLCGAVLGGLVRRRLFARARPLPAGQRRVDPLPELAQAPAGARFHRGGGSPERAADAIVPAPTAPALKAERSPEVPAAADDRPPEEPDDLQGIQGIDAETAMALNGLGVRRYAEIAAFTPAEVRRIAAALGLQGRIGRENWIEQAAILARGGKTHFLRRRARGETAHAAPTADEGEAPARAEAGAAAPTADDVPAGATAELPPHPQPAEARNGDRPGEVSGRVPAGAPALAIAGAAAIGEPEVSTRAAFADLAALSASAPAREGSLAPAASAMPRDELARILGITSELARLLAGEGVLRYSQIAQWSAADVRRLEERLGIPGLIGRENWIEQAQILSRGGDTAFSREYDRRTAAPPTADAGAASSVLGSLRSVRAEAYRNPEPGPQAAGRVAARDRVLRAGHADDLKRIRGIGVLIERKLNAMGVIGYEQIANWTAKDIDRVSQSLDFKGRIERENWVEQARILASGGATEFARRFDRGEVESGRSRS